jgi:hypothetical protein
MIFFLIIYITKIARQQQPDVTLLWERFTEFCVDLRAEQLRTTYIFDK